jgi:hypothetical protein
MVVFDGVIRAKELYKRMLARPRYPAPGSILPLSCKPLWGKGRRRARSSALHQKIDAPIPFTFNANGDHAELTFHPVVAE